MRFFNSRMPCVGNGLLKRVPISPHRKLSLYAVNPFCSAPKGDLTSELGSFSVEPDAEALFRSTLKLVLAQKTEFSPVVSDHRAALSYVGKLKILVFNMMMQGKEKIVEGEIVYNNGFKLKETDKDYQARIARVMNQLVKILSDHPEINVVALQEAPIRHEDILIMADIVDKFLPEWHAGQFDMTDFGLMTFIRTEKKQNHFYVDTVLEMALESKKKRLSTRCQTFSNGGRYKFSNIHVEHTGAEQSLRTILEAIVDDAIANQIKLHDVAGDFNSNFERVQTVLREVWIAKCRELRLDTNHPALKLEARFDASPKGHRKADGSEIDADGILSLKFSRADGKQNQFVFGNGRLHYLAAMILGSLGTAVSMVIPEMKIQKIKAVVAGVKSVVLKDDSLSVGRLFDSGHRHQ